MNIERFIALFVQILEWIATHWLWLAAPFIILLVVYVGIVIAERRRF